MLSDAAIEETEPVEGSAPQQPSRPASARELSDGVDGVSQCRARPASDATMQSSSIGAPSVLEIYPSRVARVGADSAFSCCHHARPTM